MKLRITVHGVPYDVDVEVLDVGDELPAHSALPTAPSGNSQAQALPSQSPAANLPGPSRDHFDKVVTSPIAGTVQEILCSVGQAIAAEQPLIVMEAMKMKTRITAPFAGSVRQISVAVGDAVVEGQRMVELS